MGSTVHEGGEVALVWSHPTEQTMSTSLLTLGVGAAVGSSSSPGVDELDDGWGWSRAQEAAIASATVARMREKSGSAGLISGGVNATDVSGRALAFSARSIRGRIWVEGIDVVTVSLDAAAMCPNCAARVAGFSPFSIADITHLCLCIRS